MANIPQTPEFNFPKTQEEIARSSFEAAAAPLQTAFTRQAEDLESRLGTRGIAFGGAGRDIRLDLLGEQTQELGRIAQGIGGTLGRDAMQQAFQASEAAKSREFQAGESQLSRELQKFLQGEEFGQQEKMFGLESAFQTDERLGAEAFTAAENLLGRKFTTSEREALQEFQTGERLGAESFQTGEREALQEFQTEERLGEEAFQAAENLLGRKFTTSEREALQRFQAAENLLGRKFTTSEREALQRFQTGERLGAQAFTAAEREDIQEFQTEEREDIQEFQTGERLGVESFTTSEREATEKFEKLTLEDQQRFLTDQARADRTLKKFLQGEALDAEEDNLITQLNFTEEQNNLNRILQRSLQGEEISSREKMQLEEQRWKTVENEYDRTLQETLLDKQLDFSKENRNLDLLASGNLDPNSAEGKELVSSIFGEDVEMSTNQQVEWAKAAQAAGLSVRDFSKMRALIGGEQFNIIQNNPKEFTDNPTRNRMIATANGLLATGDEDLMAKGFNALVEAGALTQKFVDEINSVPEEDLVETLVNRITNLEAEAEDRIREEQSLAGGA